LVTWMGLILLCDLVLWFVWCARECAPVCVGLWLCDRHVRQQCVSVVSRLARVSRLLLVCRSPLVPVGSAPSALESFPASIDELLVVLHAPLHLPVLA
jgi:hypothetical protein